MVEIKMELNTSILMKELFPFNPAIEEQYVPSNYQREYFKASEVNTNNYKMYTLAYQKYAKENNYNLKSLTFHFVAPKVSKQTYELAFVLNHGYKTINNIPVRIYIYTYETFYNQLLNLIPKSKWYIINQIPFNCMNSKDVNLLVKENKAVIV